MALHFHLGQKPTDKPTRSSGKLPSSFLAAIQSGPATHHHSPKPCSALSSDPHAKIALNLDVLQGPQTQLSHRIPHSTPSSMLRCLRSSPRGKLSRNEGTRTESKSSPFRHLRQQGAHETWVRRPGSLTLPVGQLALWPSVPHPTSRGTNAALCALPARSEEPVKSWVKSLWKKEMPCRGTGVTKTSGRGQPLLNGFLYQASHNVLQTSHLILATIQ